jgi:hypothetical protein
MIFVYAKYPRTMTISAITAMSTGIGIGFFIRIYSVALRQYPQKERTSALFCQNVVALPPFGT